MVVLENLSLGKVRHYRACPGGWLRVVRGGLGTDELHQGSWPGGSLAVTWSPWCHDQVVGTLLPLIISLICIALNLGLAC